jgi:hypothetical protein
MVPSLKFSGAISPLILCATMGHIETLFYLHLHLCTSPKQITSFVL